MRSFVIFAALFTLTAFRGDKPAYLFYTQTGKSTSYEKLLKEAAGADVVLFGELHNNPICHWFELQLAKDLAAQLGTNLVFGAEMFEADNQQALTRYVSGQTSDKEFAKEARLWQNYDTDYRPIVDLARDKKLTFAATNVPRRYASLVSRQGLAALDTVSVAGKQNMAKLPLTVDLTLPGYKGMLEMMGTHGGSTQGGPQVENFARAQALKDATMARFILENGQFTGAKSGRTVLHFNGDYHSKNFEGIVWYLRQQQPNLKIVTISSVEGENIAKPQADWKGLATYVLAIPGDMTKTY
ncbi:ChaN family lipoprotein [Fibrella forsythiae]|uniref:ChaN family lipoprotein n=1 Tax=Fibrella forsythiae TaxID=2817061 RepID=A0ABS3JIB1_9BACT|nr:ChaN family lipoprotein [Fibrella forsythiae]MBO0949743.1 ChaN family lipoprotein [Fibrella forsythiae]